MLNRGIRLSGESREFFARGRLSYLRSKLPPERGIKRVIDFGCGTGNTSALLAETYPGAAVLGVDTAGKALEYAREKFGSPTVAFLPLEGLQGAGPFDLCYVNGVFHHIEPEERIGTLQSIRKELSPNGKL